MPSLVDILAVIVLVFGVFQGIRRRFSGELAGFIATILVFVVGLLLFQPVGIWLQAHSRLTGRGAQAVAFLVVLLVSIVLSVAVCFVISRLVRLVLAKPADRFLGAFAGLLRAAIFVVIFFILMNLWPHEYVNHIFGEASLIGRAVRGVLPEIEEVIEERTEG